GLPRPRRERASAASVGAWFAPSTDAALARSRLGRGSPHRCLVLGLPPTANEVRRRFGLPRLRGRVPDEYGRVPLFLVAGTPELDYERTDLPCAVHYVGACVWKGGTAPPPIPAWLAELSRDRPVIHVTEGTVHTREPLVLRAASEGLRDLPMHVILSTGAHRQPDELDLGPRGANVRLEQFGPQPAL